jgi:predicted nucleic acid-binding protein
MTAVVLDTNVVSDRIRDGIEPTIRERGGWTITLTFVTVGELAAWSLIRPPGSRPAAS